MAAVAALQQFLCILVPARKIKRNVETDNNAITLLFL